MNREPEFVGEDKASEQARYAAEALERARLRNDSSMAPEPVQTSDATLNWGGGEQVATSAVGERPFDDDLARVAGVSASKITATEPERLGPLSSTPDGRSPGALSGVDAITNFRGGR